MKSQVKGFGRLNSHRPKVLFTQSSVTLRITWPLKHHLNKATTENEKKANLKSNQIRKSLTTSAIKLDQGTAEQVEHTAPSSASTRLCIFCKGEYVMETCNKLKGKPHKEKLEFLRSKGHMSKLCKAKVSCEVCSLTHLTAHIKKKEN